MSTEDTALAEIKEKFAGKWKVDRSECLEDFLREMGVNVVFRKLASFSKPTTDISVADGKLHVITDMGFFRNVDDITLNVEYEKEQHKVLYKMFVTYEEGKVKMKLTPATDSSGKPQTVTRERVGEEMLLTIYIGDVVCKRYSKRMN